MSPSLLDGRVDAIYARQSIEKKDSISIESQIQKCQRLADSNAVIYQDSGYSGKNIRRPAFTQLLEAVRAGEIKRVFCYRLDRISRSVYDFSLLWNVFDQHHVQFTSVTESFDTNTPMGRAMVMIIMTFAQLERETIVGRYTSNRYARSNAGIWAGGKAPYGFRIVKQPFQGKQQSVLEPVPEQTEILKRMFSEYANGTCSLYSLAKSLNQAGVPAEGRSGYWDAARIRRILRNPVYVRADVDVYSYYYSNTTIVNDVHEFDGIHGCYLTVKGGKSSPDGPRTLSLSLHEGIIPSEQFLSVQTQLNGNQQIKNGVHSRFTWLSGLLKCAGCGGRVSVFQHANRQVYLQCYRRFHTVGACSTVIHGNISVYESYVANAIQGYLNTLPEESPVDIAPNKQVNALKVKLIENERQIANLIEAIKLGGATAMRAVRAELAQLEAEEERITAEIAAIKPKRRLPAGLTVFQFHTLDYDGKRNVARMLIDHILVGGNDPVKIVWK